MMGLTHLISNISGDLIVSGHEGSGAFINVEKITFGIKKRYPKYS